jgi:tetrahydrodipicolinate N-succinyltransferase
MNLSRIPAGLMSRWRNCSLRLRGARIDGYCWLRGVDIPRGHRRIRLGTGVMLDRGVTLLCSEGGTRDGGMLIDLGDSVYVNRNTIIDASEGIAVGERCMIGPGCYITDHDHQITPGGAPGDGALVGKPVTIGARAWLGAHAMVLKGVQIGAGAVVGAGSVVTRDVPAGTVAVGNPARVVRHLEPT